MLRLIAIALFLLLMGAGEPNVGAMEDCTTQCRPTDLAGVHPEHGLVTLKRIVTIAPEALPLERPLMVRIEAFASSEVRWNGVVIARNGRLGSTSAEEQPGRLVSTAIVPAQLLRSGPNEVIVRLAARRLWLPVVRPVHIFEVERYSPPQLGRILHYLPALLSLGALLAAGAYFAVSAANVGDRQSLLLAAIAAATAAQLCLEVTRAFFEFSYPWALARVALIALLAGVSATLIAAYGAVRFRPGWRRPLIAIAALACAGALIFIGPFDLKAAVSLFAGVTILCVAAAFSTERGSDRNSAIALFLVSTMAAAADPSRFLDVTWFVIVSIVLAALVAQQVMRLKRTREERDAATAQAAVFARRLARAEKDGEPIVQLKDGSRQWRVAQDEIVWIKAVDDYCEVAMCDGRMLLVTMGLSRLLDELPKRFVRIHKSWAVNRMHVTAEASRQGGGRLLTLSNGDAVPVGRTFSGNWSRALLADRGDRPISA